MDEMYNPKPKRKWKLLKDSSGVIDIKINEFAEEIGEENIREIQFQAGNGWLYALISYSASVKEKLDDYHKGVAKQIKTEDVRKSEARAPMNATCSKCGKVYCDHEEKY